MTLRSHSWLVSTCILALGVWVPGCGPDDPPDDIDRTAPVEQATPQQMERARTAADALGGELQQTLFAALEDDGPLGAIEVCAVEAQEISRRQSDDALVVRRTSLLTRNPVNDPDAYEADRLADLSLAHARGELPSEEAEIRTEDGERVLRYLRPIVVAEPCLTCHGDPGTIEPVLLERIRSHYPDDRAVGYEAGDLRGVVSVRLRLDDDEPATAF